MEDKSKFIIYVHINKKNNKKYVGYTSLSLNDRFHKHYINAMAGIDTKFYRAIRKYGVESFESKILEYCNSHEEAKISEIKYIKLFDSYKNGYNMTLGGDGGYIIKYLPDERIQLYLEKRSNATKKEKNPNYSGYTDEDLINFGIELYHKYGYLGRRLWQIEAKRNGYPQSFSKNRFNGSWNYFIKLIENKLKLKLFGYIKTEKHKIKISEAIKGRFWVNNGVIEKQVTIIPDGFIKGRLKE